MLLAAVMAGTIYSSPPKHLFFHLVPENTEFRATGTTAFAAAGGSFSCTTSYLGRTTSEGKAHISRVFYSGSSACGAIVATGLPWQFEDRNLVFVKFDSFGVSVPIANDCSAQLKYQSANLDPNGVLSGTMRLSATCSVSFDLQTSPEITIQSNNP